MRKSFVQNIFFLLLVNLIVKPIWIFAIDLKVQNTVGYATYGQYVALLNFSLMFQILLDFGMQSYNTRIIAQSPLRLKRLFPNMIIAKLLLSVVYLAVVMLLGLLAGFRDKALWILLALCAVQILNSFVLYLRSNIAGMQRFKTDSILSVTDKLVMIAICSVLLYGSGWVTGTFKIEWFVFAQIAAYLLTAIAAFSLTLRHAHFDWKHFDYRRTLAICRKSLPYATLIFLMSVYIRSDALLIERLLPDGAHETGVFAAAFRLLDVSNNVTGVLFAGILLPLFGRLLAERNPIAPIIRTGVNLLLPVALTVCITAWFFGNEIMLLQHQDATPYDSRVFSVLMITFPAYCISYVYATLLTANGNIRILIFISVLGVIISLCGNLLLIPRYGALGAAITACCVHLSVALLNLIAASRYFNLKKDGVWIVRIALFAFIMLFVVRTVHVYVESFFMAMLWIAGGAMVGMFACGLFSFRMLHTLMKNIRR